MFDRPKSLTELVTETLQDWIVSGKIEMGSQLSEARLAKEMKVSRTPVREALNRLEIEGLLCVEPQRGSFVFSLAPDELAKLCDARVCLETAALEAAIRNDAPRLHKKLAALVEEMKKARAKNDDTVYLALDTEFHQAFFDCSGNHFLNDAYQTIALKMATIRNRLGRHPEHMKKSFREHEQMRDAVADADAERAIRILALHIDRKEGSYWDVATQPDAATCPNK